MAKLEPLELLVSLINPEHKQDSVLDTVMHLESEPDKMIEAVADAREKAPPFVQADDMKQYIVLKQRYAEKNDSEAVQRICVKLETLADGWVKEGMWVTDVAEITNNPANIIKAYFEAGAHDKIREFARLAQENNRTLIAKQALEQLDETLSDKEYLDGIVEEMINGAPFSDLKILKLVRELSATELRDVGFRAHAKLREKLVEEYVNDVLQTNSYVLLSGYLRKNPELHARFPKIEEELFLGRHVYNVLTEIKTEHPEQYLEINAMLVSAIRESNNKPSTANNKDMRRKIIFEAEQLMRSITEGNNEFLSIADKYYQVIASQKTEKFIRLIKDNSYKSDLHKIITNMYVLFKEANYARGLSETARIKESAGHIFGMDGALKIYSLIGRKKKLTSLLRKEVNNHIKKKTGCEDANPNDILDSRMIDFQVLELLESVDDKESFKGIADFYYANGLTYESLEMYKKAGLMPDKKKLKVIASKCYDQGRISDYANIMELLGQECDFRKIMKGTDIAIKNGNLEDAREALSSLKTRKNEEKNEVVDKLKEIGGSYLAKEDYSSALSLVWLSTVCGDLGGILIEATKLAGKKNDMHKANLWANILSYDNEKKILTRRGYRNNKKLLEELISISNFAAEGCLDNLSESGELERAFIRANNPEGLFALASRQIEAGWYDRARMLYGLIGKSEAEFVSDISRFVKSKIIHSLKIDLKKGLDCLVALMQDDKSASYFKLDVIEEKASNGHLSQVFAVDLKTENLLGDFGIVIKVDDYIPAIGEMQKLDLENCMYSVLEKEGLKTPKILKLGRIDNHYVGVMEYVSGELLTQMHISASLLDDVVAITEKVQDSLNTNLTLDEKKALTEPGFENKNFYSNKIVSRFMNRMGIGFDGTCLGALDEYLANSEMREKSVVITDRNPSNLIYNNQSSEIQLIDFNASRVSLPEEDWVFFIDDPRIRTDLTRDEMIRAYAKSDEEIKTFHYMAVYRNLIQTAMRWADEHDKNVSYHCFKRARESAVLLGLHGLVSELDDKLASKYAAL